MKLQRFTAVCEASHCASLAPLQVHAFTQGGIIANIVLISHVANLAIKQQY